MNNSILQEQITYYRERAAEYDEWFYRKGRYDHGEVLNQKWADEVAIAKKALYSLEGIDSALELASGTGIWTQELAEIANHVTARDASPEMIAINQAKLQADNVSYIQTDLFDWHPEQKYDLVFFSFWLSHVPPEKLQPFLRNVRQALKPDGQCFIIDSRRAEKSTAKNQNVYHDGVYQNRTLNDGREFQIVKIYYEPVQLQAALADAGIAATVSITSTYIIYADGTPV